MNKLCKLLKKEVKIPDVKLTKYDFFGIIIKKFFLEVMSISLRNCEQLTDIFYSILRDYYFNQYLKNIDLKLSAFSFVKQYVPDGISL